MAFTLNMTRLGFPINASDFSGLEIDKPFDVYGESFSTNYLAARPKIFPTFALPPMSIGRMDTSDGALELPTLQPMNEPSSYSTEAGLVAACRRQDVRAFEVLYKNHGSQLKSVAYHITCNHQDAEDAVQETFLRAFRAIREFRGQSTLKTWLWRIAANVCFDMSRKRKTETEFTAIHDRGTSGPAQRLALESVIRRLSHNHRMVFLLFAVEGMKHSEIAAILNVPEGTSKSWLFEAKKELQRMLESQR